MEEEGNILVNFKILGNSRVESLELPPDVNLETIKALVSDFCTIPTEEMRIIYKGHALKEVDTLQSLGIKSGETLIIVPTRKTARPAADPSDPVLPAPSPAPAPNTDQNPEQSLAIQTQQPEQQPNQNPQPERHEAQQMIEVRKQIAKLQKQVVSLNGEIVKLQITIRSGNGNDIAAKITELQTKINEALPQIQEMSNDIHFDPNGEIYINPPPPPPPQQTAENVQQAETLTPPQQPATPAPDPDDAPAPTPVQQPTQQAPQVPAQPVVNPDESPIQRNEPNPQHQAAHEPQIGNFMNQLFGGGGAMGNRPQPAQPAQQPPADVFTQEEKDLMAADAAKIAQEGYIKQLHDSYCATDIYHDVA